MNLLCFLQLAIFNSMAPALRLVIKFTTAFGFLESKIPNTHPFLLRGLPVISALPGGPLKQQWVASPVL